MVFEYFFEFSKNVEKCGFCEYCACFNADSEACGCGIDMIDSALETLDPVFFFSFLQVAQILKNPHYT